MKKTVLMLACAAALTAQAEIELPATQYVIERNQPSPNFFEGAVLGNGAMGIVVTTRPDAVLLHFGHNNVWDIRIAEDNREALGTFADIFARADALPDSLPSIQHDQGFADYLQLSARNYHHSYPRPFPCGTLLLGFDRRKVELLGHRVDIATGECRVEFLTDGRRLQLHVRPDMERDDVWLSLTDETERPAPSCFDRLRLMPDATTPGEFPRYTARADEHSLAFYQRLPREESERMSERDKAFCLQVASNHPLATGQRTMTLGQLADLAELERYVRPAADESAGFIAVASLREGEASDSARLCAGCPAAVAEGLRESALWADSAWTDYWRRSGVELADKELEALWYRNLYFFNCALKPGVKCPGIFANWSYGNVGTAWHGDYHLNYNTQQPFWVTFSSNHLDKNLVYADLVDHLLPVSRQWAKEYYGMRGAFFPHSAYPVEMTLHPYPVPDWGWEVFETPWMVQGLWWHYLYSADRDFLRDRAFGPIREAVLFLCDYISRPDAHGSRWPDGKYHIFPSVPPELYGLQPGFKFNHDTQIDLALTRFVFKAYLEAMRILGFDRQEKELAAQVRRILPQLPDYPVSRSEEYGEIYVSVPGEKDGMVYNVPANLTHVFPGEDYGLASPDSIRTRLANTVHAHRNEGGNDIVFVPMQQARLGLLDLEQFKRQVRYATLPNATVTDAVMQTGGRYDDRTDFMYMGGMGIWFENFALPAVINECLMQSYDGTIRLFPNWPREQDARFTTLRARGAFLVSAALRDGEVQPVHILSERGGTVRLLNPWAGRTVTASAPGKSPRKLSGDVLTLDTQPGETWEIAVH